MTLKNKIYKHVTTISKDDYIDNKLDNIVGKNSNTYSAIKMKPIVVNSGTYIDFNVENNTKDQKIRIFLHKVTILIGLKKLLF